MAACILDQYPVTSEDY